MLGHPVQRLTMERNFYVLGMNQKFLQKGKGRNSKKTSQTKAWVPEDF